MPAIRLAARETAKGSRIMKRATITDSAQILNQHGTDPGDCLHQNEFEDWSPVP